jgi:hypothetical protein
LDDSIYDPDDFKNYDDNDVIFIYLIDDTVNMITTSTMKANLAFLDREQEKQNFMDFGTPVYEQGFYDQSSLYAAFISGNNEVWQCMMSNAYRQAADVVKIYEIRTKALDSDMGFSLCSGYSASLSQYNELYDNLVGNPIRIHDIKGNIIAFDTYNIHLERSSCPLLY